MSDDIKQPVLTMHTIPDPEAPRQQRGKRWQHTPKQPSPTHKVADQNHNRGRINHPYQCRQQNNHYDDQYNSQSRQRNGFETIPYEIAARAMRLHHHLTIRIDNVVKYFHPNGFDIIKMKTEISPDRITFNVIDADTDEELQQTFLLSHVIDQDYFNLCKRNYRTNQK